MPARTSMFRNRESSDMATFVADCKKIPHEHNIRSDIGYADARKHLMQSNLMENFKNAAP